MNFKTEQENFWASKFGDEYTIRNHYKKIPSRIARFARVISKTRGVKSFLELGANVGPNVIAIKTLIPNADITAVEINETAYNKLSQIEHVKAYNESILEFNTDEKFDFVFISGVLIHINPDELNIIYEKMYNMSTKYIWLCEYYNPVPVELDYRGEREKLFKRDFAGEILDKYPSLKLIDYAFNYHRDYNFPADDSTWFLLEK